MKKQIIIPALIILFLLIGQHWLFYRKRLFCKFKRNGPLFQEPVSGCHNAPDGAPGHYQRALDYRYW